MAGLITFVLKVITTNHTKKKVKASLTFFLCLLMGSCCLVNCRSLSIENDEENIPVVYHQPKYVLNYWIKARKFPLEGGIKPFLKQAYVFFPPLSLNAQGQITENYTVSSLNNDDAMAYRGQIYQYGSDFIQSARGFSGFIDVLRTYFDRDATRSYIYQMPENLNQAIMVKYYYRVNDNDSTRFSQSTSQMVLIISIENMSIQANGMEVDAVWKGEMVLNLSPNIDWREAVNYGYQKLSEYVLMDVTKKERANLLNF